MFLIARLKVFEQRFRDEYFILTIHYNCCSRYRIIHLYIFNPNLYTTYNGYYLETG